MQEGNGTGENGTGRGSVQGEPVHGNYARIETGAMDGIEGTTNGPAADCMTKFCQLE